MRTPRSLLILACCSLLAACAPQAAPRTKTAPSTARISSVPRPAVDVRPGEKPKRTGLHPDLFEDSPQREEIYVEPTPTATPTPEFPAGTTTPSATPEPEAEPQDLGPPRGESLDGLIASAAAPNIAAALRLVEQGRQQLANGRSDAALDLLEHAVAIDPTNAQGYYYLGVLHYDRGSYSQAIAFANRAVVLASSGDATWASRTYLLQATVYEKVGRYPDARTAYKRALDLDPGNASARSALNRLGGANRDPNAP
jgi:hypothetical protein